MDQNWIRGLRKAPATLILVAVNTLVFVACLFSGDALQAAGDLDVSSVCKAGEYGRLISAMFLHADLSHLFGNMILLLYAGAMVEQALGHLPFLILYLLCGISGNGITIQYEIWTENNWSSIGASGAVFGVLGAMLILLIDRRKQLAGAILLRRLGLMILFSLMIGASSKEVNNVAHIGGLLSGMLMTWIYLLISANRVRGRIGST